MRGQRYEQKRFSTLNFNEEETQKQAKGTYILLCMNVQKFFNMETFLWSDILRTSKTWHTSCCAKVPYYGHFFEGLRTHLDLVVCISVQKLLWPATIKGWSGDKNYLEMQFTVISEVSEEPLLKLTTPFMH